MAPRWVLLLLTGIRFSHMWPLGSSPAPPEARGRSPGSFGITRGIILGPISTLGGSFRTIFEFFFWKVSCPGSVWRVATCLLLEKHIVGTSKADRRRLRAHRRSISLENNIGSELKITPQISQQLARIFHGKHLGGAALPGVGGRGRRPFQSADPEGLEACGAV